MKTKNITQDFVALHTKVDTMAVDIKEIKDAIKPIVEVKTDVDWLKRFFWVIVTGTLSALTIAIVSAVIKK